MQTHEALAQIEVIIDDLSNGELFNTVGEDGYLLLREALEVVQLALQGKIFPTEANQRRLMTIISEQLTNPPDAFPN